MNRDNRSFIHSFIICIVFQTYAADFQTTDSAASATAILCGIKSNEGTVGLTDECFNSVCASEKGNEVESILYKAQRAGGLIIHFLKYILTFSRSL